MKVVALRSRPAGGGFKPPQAALVGDRCGERWGKGVRDTSGGDREGERKRIADEVSILLGGIETRALLRPWEESGGYPFTGQVVPGMKATRARSAAFTRNVGGHAPILLLAGVRAARGSARKRREP
jgi:hypothetical protein